jgi:hypothetical protein
MTGSRLKIFISSVFINLFSNSFSSYRDLVFSVSVPVGFIQMLSIDRNDGFSASSILRSGCIVCSSFITVKEIEVRALSFESGEVNSIGDGIL